jgi:hypothetical protein
MDSSSYELTASETGQPAKSVGQNKMTTELIVRLNDWHIPHQDLKAVELQLKFCREIQPNTIIIDEWHDFYEVSKYDKDPSRHDDLQNEIDEAERYIGRLRKYCPKARIILLDSNHLDRLRRYLWSEARALSSLRALNIDQLLNLEKYKVEFKKDFNYRGVFFKHGNVVRRFSAYSAKGEFEKEQMSGVSGHTHRLGLYFHTSRAGKYFWMESGCACRLDAEYIEGIANWQLGFSAVRFDEGEATPILIPIVDYKIHWGDKVIR